MNKKFITVLTTLMVMGAACLFAEDAEKAQAAASVAGSAIKYIAAAIAVGIACIGGGAAVGKIGSAAMGAMAENAELSGKALPFVGLAEGICLWGFLVALFIIIM